MTKDEVTVQGFIGVFEHKLEKMKKRIKEELAKPKKERSKDVLKRIVKEANGLKKVIKKYKKVSKKCPHCGEEIE